MHDKIVILDFGSQYAQLIARRVREMQVFCELVPWNATAEALRDPSVKGYILSGGPNSVYGEEAPKIPEIVLQSGLPILGICYGMQALAHQLGGEVSPEARREYGLAEVAVKAANPLLEQRDWTVWMSHGDRVTRMPPSWHALATSENCPIAAMADPSKHRYALQFHPEVKHTRKGSEILRNFVLAICEAQASWTAQSIIEQSIAAIRAQVGEGIVLSAVSGGVDSSVATALARRAVGDQVKGFFIDTGLLRLNEREQVEKAFAPLFGEGFKVIDARARFIGNLEGETDPETKRKIVGETFIREFEAAARQFGNVDFLCQGTIYPDVVESQGIGAKQAQRIKSHHNVGGLPSDMQFKLVEPLRWLFKDEVRAVGEALGLPHELVWRQPFPGPGLAVRVVGEVTQERVLTLQKADDIFTSELAKAGLLQMVEDEAGKVSGSSQAFAALLPVRSVGVMGDQRTYAETIALRAVTTTDFMTADWARLPYELMAKVSNRIVNEVPGVNRVVYDISSKPPATIEWE
ncbi:MAG: glutamine-hydrolyzing GMP synthase [Anaerolineaceae bacterium]|nr:glutamine-hydrolyzing GMP synthase [Anaerolineaceae bacterium]